MAGIEEEERKTKIKSKKTTTNITKILYEI